MRLELDLSVDDWKDYAAALVGDLQRIGIITPIEPVGVRAFVRLGAVADDGTRVVVMTPWLIWQAAHRALAEHLGETPAPAERAGVVLGEEAAPEPTMPPALAAVADAMTAHAHRWGLDASHPDGTDPDTWTDHAKDYRADATAAAMTGELTWAHTLLEAAHGALATEDPAQLRQALAAVAGTAAAWMTAIEERS